MAGPQRFFDPSQPQTLQIATMLLYLDAFFAFLNPFGFAIPFAVIYAACAYGMANGKKGATSSPSCSPCSGWPRSWWANR